MFEHTRTVRVTGLLYLGLAITGVLGFLLVRPRLYDAGDAASTLQNLVEHEGLARLGVAVELGIVLTQALVAVWFFLIFRAVDSAAAGALAAFGMVNATIILASAGCLLVSLEVARGDVAVADAAGSVQLPFALSGALWEVGSLFFGLWLLPMGWLALKADWMPSALGWILVLGAIGYVASGFVVALAPDATAVSGALPLFATIGEVWMIGQLLFGRTGSPASRSPERSAV